MCITPTRANEPEVNKPYGNQLCVLYSSFPQSWVALPQNAVESHGACSGAHTIKQERLPKELAALIKLQRRFADINRVAGQEAEEISRPNEAFSNL
jgi:hypothetical protein